MSLAGRLMNIFADPAGVFDAIKASAPSVGNWLVPMLALIVVGLVGVSLAFPQPAIQQQFKEMTDQMIQKMVEKQHVPEAQAEQARPIISASVKAGPFMAPVIIAVVTPFWGGLIVWLGARVFKSPLPYMRGLEVAGLANTILILDAVVRTLLMFIMGNIYASLSPALLVKGFNPQNPVHGLLAALSVMTFWTLAVRSLGMARVTGISFAKAAGWIFGAWILVTGLFAGVGMAMQGLGPK